jgi:cbb3-type cytochrome oxidase subunit 3
LLIWLTFVPIVLASNALPITVAGIGVREYLLVLFLGVIAGVDSERAIATSFVIFAMILMMCLLGGLLYIFYRPKRKAVTVEEPGTPPEVAEA